MKLKDLTIRELIDADIAASLICKNYENGIKQYDGSIKKNTAEYEAFSYFNDVHLTILKELENRLRKIE